MQQWSQHQPSVLDCFAPCAGDTARQWLRRARLCSRLAKLVRGHSRKKLYRLKNANIRAALDGDSGSIAVHGDRIRYFGLLSVQFTGRELVRVHTHENWLNAV